MRFASSVLDRTDSLRYIRVTGRRMPDLSLEWQEAARGGSLAGIRLRTSIAAGRLRVRHNPQDDTAMRVGSRRKHRGKLVFA